MKAALHVHSTYSDGEYTLPELKRLFIDAGCSVVGITDHDDSFDAAKLADYVSECASLSDDRFQFLCSLEYRAEQEMHILGYGATVLARTQEPQKIIRHIREHGGLPVIAHPRDSMFPWIESFDVLPDGIETWNSKYDGQYAPRTATFELLRRLRTRISGMHAFYGQDLHWKKQFRGLFNEIECESFNRGDLLQALRAGKYFGVKGNLSLPSTGELAPEIAKQFAARHARSIKMRNLIKAGKKAIDKLGIKPPASIKSHVRRIF